MANASEMVANAGSNIFAVLLGTSLSAAFKSKPYTYRKLYMLAVHLTSLSSSAVVCRHVLKKRLNALI
jgi:hypothetical protein